MNLIWKKTASWIGKLSWDSSKVPMVDACSNSSSPKIILSGSSVNDLHELWWKIWSNVCSILKASTFYAPSIVEASCSSGGRTNLVYGWQANSLTRISFRSFAASGAKVPSDRNRDGLVPWLIYIILLRFQYYNLYYTYRDCYWMNRIRTKSQTCRCCFAFSEL